MRNKRSRETKMEWLRARRKWKAQIIRELVNQSKLHPDVLKKPRIYYPPYIGKKYVDAEGNPVPKPKPFANWNGLRGSGAGKLAKDIRQLPPDVTAVVEGQDFGGADEGEGVGVKDHDEVLALVVGQLDIGQLALERRRGLPVWSGLLDKGLAPVKRMTAGLLLVVDPTGYNQRCRFSEISISILSKLFYLKLTNEEPVLIRTQA